MEAAACGGITTLCYPPDTDPVIDTPAVMELIQKRAQKEGKAHLVILGALTQGLKGESLSEILALKTAGCVGVTNAWEPVVDLEFLRRAYQYAATFHLKIFIQPEDVFLSRRGSVHEGSVSARLGLIGIPSIAETIALATHLEVIRETGISAHFGRLSSGESIRLIQKARQAGLPITADVAVHQLHLTEAAVEGFNAFARVKPPFRLEADRKRLRKGVAGGVIQAICSDHQPHDFAAKTLPFEQTEPGLSGLETLLPLALDLYHQKEMSLSEVLACLTHKPAEILGIAAGHLAVGMPADICIFDPNASWQVDASSFKSAGHNTPFEGWKVKGQVKMTLFEGKVVHMHM